MWLQLLESQQSHKTFKTVFKKHGVNLQSKIYLAPLKYWISFKVKRYMYTCTVLDTTESTLLNVMLPCKVNDSYIASVCGSACRKEANDYFKEKCGVSLGEICKSTYMQPCISHTTLFYFDTVCSKDPRDQHYCFTYNKRLHTLGQFSEAVQGPCASKDCSDPTCNAAVKNVC